MFDFFIDAVFDQRTIIQKYHTHCHRPTETNSSDLWFFESLTLPDTKCNDQREKEIQRIHIYKFILLNTGTFRIIAYGIFNLKLKVVLLISWTVFTAILTCLYRYFYLDGIIWHNLWPRIRSWPFTCIISLGSIQSHNSLTRDLIILILQIDFIITSSLAQLLL